MRWKVGVLYILTGLLCKYVAMLITGALLGMTTPIYAVRDLFLAPLVSTGPSLLVLAGVAMLFEHARRSLLCLATGSLVVAAIAAWTVPKIGWRDAIWLLLEPQAVSFLIASLIVLVVKKRWILAVIGSVLSAPFFLYGTGVMVYDLVFRTAIFSMQEIWIFGPAVLTTLSFVSALWLRTE
jgi:hypothetical protein